MLGVTGLAPEDREAWEALFRGYIDFYQRVEPQEMYDRAWLEFQAGVRLYALGAKGLDCDRVYWTTQTTNATARALYDQVAEDRGFMVYRIPLQPPR